MEQYERKIKMQKYFLSILLLASIALIIVIGELGRMNILPDSRSLSEFAKAAQGNIFAGWILYLVVQIRKHKNLLGSEEKMGEQYLKDNDERRIYINGLVGNLGYNVLISCLFMATLAASFINTMVFSVLGSVLLGAVSLKYLLFWYFDIKF